MPPPLEGLQIVDLTRVVAGPFCTMLLGDMGAEVIKVEEPRRGDEVRGWAPYLNGWSTYFLGLNRNKKSVALDLKNPQGAEALRRLIERADVLVENLRPGSLTRLGFGFKEMEKLNSRLIYCSMSGYGNSGPRQGLPGYDVVIQGESGLMDVTGASDGPPTRVGIAISDYVAGLYAHLGILLALADREKSGRGQHVDIALLDSIFSVMQLPVGILLATGTTPRRVGNQHPSVAPYEPLRAKDGEIIVAPGNPRLWKRFCTAIGRPDLTQDPRFSNNDLRLKYRSELRSILESIFQNFSVDELIHKFEKYEVPCGRVRSVAEAINDPQLLSRDMIVEMPHNDLGIVKTLGNPVKLSRTPCSMRTPPPALGEHTEEVLAEIGLQTRHEKSNPAQKNPKDK